MQGVSFENNIVLGRPAGDQVVAVAKGRQGSTVYAQPQMTVWQWTGGPTAMTEPEGATTAFLDGTVVPIAEALRRAQQVRCHIHELLQKWSPAYVYVCIGNHVHLMCMSLVHSMGA